MKRIIYVAAAAALILLGCKDKQPIDYVNPFIGTGGHGHTYPGATYPFGMVQLSPDTRLDGWDGCSGYHYTDSLIYGFSHTHLSGTGVSDYGDILLMPISGEPLFNNGADGQPGYRSDFFKKNENASAGYYSVLLNKDKIDVELTASARVGAHRYRYSKANGAGIIIDLKHRDRVLESYIEMVNDTTIVGMRRSAAWAQDQVIYFFATTSAPVSKFTVSKNDTIYNDLKKIEGNNVKAHIAFADGVDKIQVKVAISAVDVDGAKKNYMTEAAGKDFDDILEINNVEWSKQLNKIIVSGGEEEDIETFYTALYHTMIAPNLFSDVDGRYRAMDSTIMTNKNDDTYTVFSLWDTYRATHPLYTILEQERTKSFINTFISQYQSGGIIPIWELAGNYTGCMIGYHAIPVIADAYLKGIYTENDSLLLAAMVHSADQDHLGLEHYKEYGYISLSSDAESVSKTLEYAFDDWCIAQVAKKMGRNDIYERFTKRAQSYKNIFDPESKFMRPKLNQTWKAPFDPTEVDFNYTEANSWQYSFYVPQDIYSLIDMHGGDDSFVAMLDSMFTTTAKTSGRHQADITGLIGQYAHGNEPSHHMAYLYNYAGQPWKTQEMVRRIMREQYTNKPDGLCGNEDCGQMSAWYVFSAMGLYPVNPSNGEYIIGSPIFDRVRIYFENGKSLKIWSNPSEERKYVKATSLNRKEFNNNYITHKQLMEEDLLVIKLVDKPYKEWGVSKDKRPSSVINEHKIIPLPFVNGASRTFRDSTVVTLGSIDKDTKIYYSFTNRRNSFKEYTEPFTIYDKTTLYFYSESEEGRSKQLTSVFHKTPTDVNIKLTNKWHRQYMAGGNEALIDGITGAPNFRTGDWQGFYIKDLEAEIVFDKVKYLREISINCIQDARSWIFMPKHVDFYLSADGENYTKIFTDMNTTPDDDTEVSIYTFKTRFPYRRAKSIKVVAKNPEICPEWHPGAGLGAFIFADEITFK
ncbi:MAG: GH92 family glycosyl hydrolase [Bacteroidales bacterium]|jgi:predicted alpha-1,2-mannosidase|nr:GH92 family glycosyl hydrolase [Bacteroidales bacterium]